MKTYLREIVLGATVAFAAAPAVAVPITVQNFSFESPVIPSLIPPSNSSPTVDSWTQSGSWDGTWRPGDPGEAASGFFAGIHGNQVAYSNVVGSTLSQDVSTPIAQGLYTLTIAVGDRDLSTFYGLVPRAATTISLMDRTTSTLLNSAFLAADNLPGNAAWIDLTVSYLITDPGMFGHTLGIAISNDGGGTFSNGNPGVQLDIDNVRLDFAAVPEPASLALIGLGLVGLGFARRRKK